MLNIKKHGFPGIPKDNDEKYIRFVMDALKHSDPDAELIIHKIGKEMKVNIKPSEEQFKQHIIDNLLAAHRLFHIKIVFSKSLAISKSVSYLVVWE